MKVVKIWGGVGNQLFQYALYECLKKRGDDVYVDLSWFANSNRKYYYDYQLEELNLHCEQIAPSDLFYHSSFEYELLRLATSRIYLRLFLLIYRMKRLKAKRLKCLNACSEPYEFYSQVFGDDNIYLVGYWQNRKYYGEVLKEIRNKVRFSFEKTYKENEYLSSINECEAVSVHIRRNDYDFEKFNDICSASYYQNAISIIKQKVSNPVFFIFSNDMEQARKVIGDIPEFVYVNINDRFHGLEDLYLMTECKHNILSNSTFSWWGAALSKCYSKDGLHVVTVPKGWKNSITNLDLVLDDWIEI